MALQLTKEIKGVSCNYWKILKIIQDIPLGRTILSVGLYKDAAARTADINNYIQPPFTFEWNELDKTRADCYTHLKTLDEFDGAIDA